MPRQSINFVCVPIMIRLPQSGQKIRHQGVGEHIGPFGLRGGQRVDRGNLSARSGHGSGERIFMARVIVMLYKSYCRRYSNHVIVCCMVAIERRVIVESLLR